MLDVLRKIVQEVSSAPDIDSVLDLIVRRIQRAMRTQVCSVYLYDEASSCFRLEASQGLNSEAVGHATLAISEGIVGMVAERAEPVNLENASSHPRYTYLQDTGEERFHAFLGVPIIHHRKVLGVLVVQQKEARFFDESEEAFLVTLSAQLAGVITHAEMSEPVSKNRQHQGPLGQFFSGVSGASGVAIGSIVVITPPADLDAVPHKTAKDIDAELAQFESALRRVRKDIKVLGRTLAQRLLEDERALFDVYLRMLDDNALAGEIAARIKAGSWAQGALSEVITEHVRRFSSMDDPYLRERATDIKDLGRRVLAYMQASNTKRPEYPDNTILVADELTPAMLGEVPPDKLVGMVSVHGSGNSHAAILARSMGIPTILGALNLPYRRLDGQAAIVDGYSGRVFIDPSDKLRVMYGDILRGEQELAAELLQLKDLPAKTPDGYCMPLCVNTGLVSDVTRALDIGAEGIGLYRTEIPFMVRETFPSEQEQAQTYRTQLEAFHPRPVTMRTLDIGGDKALTYFPIEEENPFLGWRGIRVTLDHPEIFLVQVRAMLRADVGLGNLRIMLPMVTSVLEVDEARSQIAQAVDELKAEGLDVTMPPVGIMIEVPATIYQIKRISERVDFISVGSNDLTQYLLAVDRNNPRVASLYESFHPAVLGALEYIARQARKVEIPVSICGEMAADPGGALLLMAMGYDVLSMNATNLPKVKSVIRSVTKTSANELLRRVLRMDDPDAIQEALRAHLENVGVTTPKLPQVDLG
ncbi:MAG: phosphoenolpyruvate--protein phosphotransferase [Pontibacterium sp.]